ncbi:MAG: ImmA/IrrE family metallo-endopeptidase [Syntrophobacteraceae bacterium]|jgi:Zn-dependent peptidase ImmA (M78 family)
MNSIGHLFRERREAFSADLKEAAQWCGETPNWLEDKEARDDLPVTDFERICRGLAISPTALLHGEGNTPTRSVSRFRAALEDPDILTPTDLRLLATACEIGLALAEVLSAQGEQSPFDRYRDLQAPLRRLQPWEHGYELGEAARALLAPPEGPIFELEYMLTQLGIHIARTKLSTPGIEAASIWESGAVPVILLNTGATRVQYSLSRRAILAHEMCHLLHDGGEADIATRVTCAMGVCNWQEALEQRARGFAPAFLAPRRQVREWANITYLPPRDPAYLVGQLAVYWGLSFEGAIWHAKNCALIESETADGLYAADIQPDMPMDRFEREEIGSSLLRSYPELRENLAPLMEGLATKLVVEALENSVISFGRAKELLAWR